MIEGKCTLSISSVLILIIFPHYSCDFMVTLINEFIGIGMLFGVKLEV